MTLRLREAEGEALGAVESLLERHGLPTADLRDGEATFYVAEDDGVMVGVGGLELDDTAGLLRSVAVERPGNGYGQAICSRLEARARAAGVETLYLLTETAPGFFDRLGYERVDRVAAPQPVKETAEFEALCGDAAICMRKRL